MAGTQAEQAYRSNSARTTQHLNTGARNLAVAAPDEGTFKSDSGLIFDGASKRAWIDQSAATDRVSEVPDPAGGGDAVLRLHALDTDVAPLTPTDNPRAQLVTPRGLLRPGMDVWESYEFYLPASFPTRDTAGAWVTLGSPCYGEPWNGTPPVDLSLIDGFLRFQRDGFSLSPWRVEWQEPIPLSRWTRITWNLKIASAGAVRLYVDGRRVTLSGEDVSTGWLPMPVLDQSNNRGAWIAQISAYFKAHAFGSVTLFVRGFRIALSRRVAERRA